MSVASEMVSRQEQIWGVRWGGRWTQPIFPNVWEPAPLPKIQRNDPGTDQNTCSLRNKQTLRVALWFRGSREQHLRAPWMNYLVGVCTAWQGEKHFGFPSSIWWTLCLVCLSTPSNPPQFITKVPLKSQHSGAGGGGGVAVLLFFVFWPHCTVCGILVPWPGIEPGPQQWERQVLTTGSPGNSQVVGFLKTYWKVSLDQVFFYLFTYFWLCWVFVATQAFL